MGVFHLPPTNVVNFCLYLSTAGIISVFNTLIIPAIIQIIISEFNKRHRKFLCLLLNSFSFSKAM